MTDEEERIEHQKDLERLANLRLLDDDFMTAVFQDDIGCTELTLRIIMDRPALKVRRVITQDTIKNLLGRSVRLDIHAYDTAGEFNVEVQRPDKGAGARRARYNGSVMDGEQHVQSNGRYAERSRSSRRSERRKKRSEEYVD